MFSFLILVDAVRVCYGPLFKSEHFEKIRSEFKQLLEMNPSNDLLGSMHLLVCFIKNLFRFYIHLCFPRLPSSILVNCYLTGVLSSMKNICKMKPNWIIKNMNCKCLSLEIFDLVHHYGFLCTKKNYEKLHFYYYYHLFITVLKRFNWFFFKAEVFLRTGAW